MRDKWCKRQPDPNIEMVLGLFFMLIVGVIGAIGVTLICFGFTRLLEVLVEL